MEAKPIANMYLRRECLYRPSPGLTLCQARSEPDKGTAWSGSEACEKTDPCDPAQCGRRAVLGEKSEKPERYHRRTDESGEDSRDPDRVGGCRTRLTRPQREVQMEVQVEVPVLLPLLTALLLPWCKTLPLALWLITYRMNHHGSPFAARAETIF